MINCVGWTGHRNDGDEAFKEVFTRVFGTTTKFTETPDTSCEAIILGGGGVVCKNYLKGLDNYTGKLYAVGVDIPVNGEPWEKIQQLPFRHIFTRSIEYSKIASMTANNVSYCPDLAFYLYNNQIRRRSAFRTVKTIGIILSQDLHKHEHIKEHIAYSLKTLFDTGQYSKFNFITMYSESDVDFRANFDVMNKAGLSNVSTLSTLNDPMKTILAIADCDFVISMRFHGSIFANITDVPYISLANKGKSSQFCAQEWFHESFLELPDLSPFSILMRHDDIVARHIQNPEKYSRSSTVNKQYVVNVLDSIYRDIVGQEQTVFTA